MKKKLLISIFVVLFGMSIASPALAVSGFVPKQIWYSKEKLIEGETVDIHTSIWNGETDTVLVKVGFYDEETVLGSREVMVKPQELKDVSITWKVTAGEHIISAKIISSVVVIGDDKKDVSLRYTKTDEDKQDVEKQKKVVEKVKTTESETSIVDDILPEKVANSVNAGYNSVDTFRTQTSDKLNTEKDKVKEEVKLLKKEEESKKENVSSTNKKIDEVVKKPFAYIKLFLVSVLSFIFAHKIVFYGLLAFITFYILRLIYRKIRHK